jgi:hypothetical protein
VNLPSPGPRLIAAVPACQFAVLGLYIVAIVVTWLDPEYGLADEIGAAMLIGALLCGAGYALGWWASRERGTTRPDGSEYVVATLGNVLMGFGFVLSLLLWGAITFGGGA